MRKHILISGATSGIGHDAAIELAAQGYRVFAAGRRIALAKELADSDPTGNIIPLQMDVTSDDSVRKAIETIDRETDGQGIWALINSAGFSVAGVSELATDEDLRSALEVNYFGMMRITRAVLPSMHARGEGRIITLSSLAGLGPGLFIGPYMASKHAVEGISKAMRRELLPFNIQLTLIRPGPIQTAFAEGEVEYMRAHQKLGTPYSPVLTEFIEFFLDMHSKAPPTSTVTSAIRRALEAKRAPAGITLGGQIKLASLLSRTMPERSFDRMMYRAMGLTKFLRD